MWRMWARVDTLIYLCPQAPDAMARSRPTIKLSLSQESYDYLKQDHINASGLVDGLVKQNVADHKLAEAHRQAEETRAAERRARQDAEDDADDALDALDAAETEGEA